MSGKIILKGKKNKKFRLKLIVFRQENRNDNCRFRIVMCDCL